MTNSVSVVNAAIDTIVVALREGKYAANGHNVTQYCAVKDLTGTMPILYARTDKDVVLNVYTQADLVVVEDCHATPEFAAKLAELWLPLETRAERLRAKRIVENEAIFLAVVAAKGLIEDGHAQGGTTQLSHIARFGKKGGREVVVGIYDNNRFCLNQLTLGDDGKVILSSCSVGGNLDTTIQSVEEAVAGYEDFSENEMWDLTDVVNTPAPVIALGANPYPTPDRSDWVPIKFAIQANNHKIIEAVKAAGGNIRDMHRFEKMIQLSHVALFGVPGYKEKVVALIEGKLFCLNPIHLDHDEPYLSTSSCGGNVEFKELTMEERIKTYQDWDHNMLWNLTRVDGK